MANTSVQISSAVSDIKQIKDNQNVFISDLTELKQRCTNLENKNKRLEESIVSLSKEITTLHFKGKKNEPENSD